MHKGDRHASLPVPKAGFYAALELRIRILPAHREAFANCLEQMNLLLPMGFVFCSQAFATVFAAKSALPVFSAAAFPTQHSKYKPLAHLYWLPAVLVEDPTEQAELVFLPDAEMPQRIAALLRTRAQAPLHALILAGGKSTRMGEDKAKLQYHGKSQVEWLSELLAPFVERVYLSAREEQKLNTGAAILLEDEWTGMGPLSGLLTAFKRMPEASFLVVACDMPLLDAAAVKRLLQHRDPLYFATGAVAEEENALIEPLFCIWESKCYAPLLHMLYSSYQCPRKFLLNHAVQSLPFPADVLRNVNSPEDRKKLYM